MKSLVRHNLVPADQINICTQCKEEIMDNGIEHLNNLYYEGLTFKRGDIVGRLCEDCSDSEYGMPIGNRLMKLQIFNNDDEITPPATAWMKAWTG